MCKDAPSSIDGERPVLYADRVGQWYVTRRTDQQRKNLGLFLTPVLVADFMARKCAALEQQETVKILDPAAGAGILCCAAIEALVSRKYPPDAINLVAYEIDADLIAPLRIVLEYLADWCRDRHSVSVNYRIEAADFVIANARTLPLDGADSPKLPESGFDLIIANPPYFKLGKSDPRALAAANVVHGQPNIYALFMAVGAALLRIGGHLVFITPRSFASGPYFRRFRDVFFDQIRPETIHVFGSRSDAFRRDAILQENIIFSGIREDRWYNDGFLRHLRISSSFGAGDINESHVHTASLRAVIDFTSKDRILRLPVSKTDDEALALVNSWPNSLADMGLQISTGPVVPFRANQSISKEGSVHTTHVPLLWMSHVRAMQVSWPLDLQKPEYIMRLGADKLLVPNRNYVLIRRFSAKEEPRRLIAAPWIASTMHVPSLGLENHLNYVYRPGGTLTEDESWGLAAIYNSSLLDTWFRAVNGNTQVSATELRSMPLPAHDTIVSLGRAAKNLSDPMADMDELADIAIAKPEAKEAAVG